MTLLLGGCAHIPSRPVSEIDFASGHRSSQREKALQELTTWKAQGKLMAANESETLHASFTWEQKGPLYRIKFYGPLGISGGCLKGNLDKQYVFFESAQGKILKSSSPEKLIFEETGLEFPVSNLQYWIKSLAHPTYPVEYSLYTDKGLLKELRQQNWSISYANYLEPRPFQPLWLPGLIKIKSKNLYLKLAINSWVN